MSKKESKFPFIPLGFKDEDHYFYLKKDGVIFKTSAFSAINLLNMDSRANWQKNFPDKDWKKPTQHRFNLADAADELISQSKKVGLFDLNKVRGNGAWQDAGRIVVNCGNFLIIDGQKTDLEDFQSKFVYVKTLKEIPNLSISLDANETRLILETAKTFKWKRESDPYFLVGWLMLAPIAGALPVRPHIWLAGKKGTGKSTTVIEPFVLKLLANIALAGVGTSTEAGIRQAAQHNAQPLVHDEFEGMDQRSIERINRIVEYLRSCWSETAARTFKGTTTGTHLSYNARVIGFVASIIVRLPTEADRSRFTIIELQSHAEDREERLRDRKRIYDHLRAIPADCCQRLLTRAVMMIKPIIASYEILADVIAAELTSREGQQLGMLLAGYWAFEHDEAITEDQARELFFKINKSIEIEKDVGLSDEAECLNVLLTHKIRYVPDGENREVTDVIGHMIHCDNSFSTLLHHGIKVDEETDTYAIANRHSELTKMYRGTRWENGDWHKSLKGVTGAKPIEKTSFGSRDMQCRAIALPRLGLERTITEDTSSPWGTKNDRGTVTPIRPQN